MVKFTEKKKDPAVAVNLLYMLILTQTENKQIIGR